MKTVTESIFSHADYVIPMAEVQHIEHRKSGYSMIVMKSSTWNNKASDYNNAICLSKENVELFLTAWCRYRAELEDENLVNFTAITQQPVEDFFTPIHKMHSIFEKNKMFLTRTTDCTILYEVTFEQLCALYKDGQKSTAQLEPQAKPHLLTDADITSLSYDCNALPEVITDASLRTFARAVAAFVTQQEPTP